MWFIIGGLAAYTSDIKDFHKQCNSISITIASSLPLMLYGFLPFMSCIGPIDECYRQEQIASINQSFTDAMGETTCIPNSTFNSNFVEEPSEEEPSSPDLSLPVIENVNDYFIPDLSLPAFVKTDNDYSTLTVDIVDFFRRTIEQFRSQPITSGFAIVCATNFFSTLPFSTLVLIEGSLAILTLLARLSSSLLFL